MRRARPNEGLMKLPARVLRGSVIAAPNVGQMHAEGVEFIVIALRQEAQFLAMKSLEGFPLSKRERQLLGDIALALTMLDRHGTVRHAQAMLAAARDPKQLEDE
jgi:hypothetical protein